MSSFPETSPRDHLVGIRQGSLRSAQPFLVLLMALATVALSSAVCMAAVIVPAPAAVAPLVALVCVGCPLMMMWEVPGALREIAARRGHDRTLASLRQVLDELPETEHPLGL